jgi:hypothetical protein
MSTEIDEGIQLYDTELGKVLDILGEIQEKRITGRARIDRDALGNEIRERIVNEAGIVVSVRWYECGEEMPDGTVRKIEGMYKPEIVPLRRAVKELEYDHERQRHEVINDALKIGEGGLIKVTPSEVRQALSGGARHKHSKGCGH